PRRPAAHHRDRAGGRPVAAAQLPQPPDQRPRTTRPAVGRSRLRGAAADRPLGDHVIRLVAAAAAAGALVLAAPAGATPGPSDAPEYWFDSWQSESLWS